MGKIIRVIIFLIILLIVLCIFITFCDFLVKIPILDNVYIYKYTSKEYNEKIAFEDYLNLMEKDNYIYLKDERQGGILFFEKNNTKKTESYPKFIPLKWFN